MSKQRAKGTAFETAVVNYLRDRGLPVDRTGSAHYESGDIAGLPEWVVECKNQARMELAAWIDQADAVSLREQENARVGPNPCGYCRPGDDCRGATRRSPVVIHKRRGKNTAEAYVTMPLWVFADLLLTSDAA